MFKRKRAFISISSLLWGKSLTFRTSMRSCARANDANSVRSRDAQCNTEESLWGDSLVLHCTSLLRTIFASLARAYQRLRVQNVRNFLQTKVDSEINAPFLLNEHGDPHFLFHNINKNNILSNWEKLLVEIYDYFLLERERHNGPNDVS